MPSCPMPSGWAKQPEPRLPTTLAHIEALGNLPPVHRDPFDRMIMAQAIHENMTIVTHDPTFSSYPVQVVS